MQLVRREPWWIAELDQDLNRLFGRAFGPWPVARWYPALPMAEQGRWAPACDVFSRDGDLVVRMDLPGIDPDQDVQVTVQDGFLCIRGERKQETVADGGRYYRQEWDYGTFERGIRVPDGVHADDITASYSDGVLEVMVPKAALSAEPKRIEIHANGKRELAAGSA